MKYKTIFVDAATVKTKATWGMSLEEPNGDQLARDVDAAILEKEQEGYELKEAMPINAPKIYAASYPFTHTSGILLIFKLKDE